MRPINIDFAADSIKTHQSLSIFALAQAETDIVGWPGANLGFELINFSLRSGLANFLVGFSNAGIYDAELFAPQAFQCGTGRCASRSPSA